MQLSPALKKAYSTEQLSARDAQAKAEFIAWGPVVFQASRLMIKFVRLGMLRDADNGLTRADLVSRTGLSDYAVKCLLEAGLCIGTVLVDPETDVYTLSKTGWFLLNSAFTRANIDFNHDVNYEGWFKLEESLVNGKPEGLKHFGSWATVYEALSELPPQVQKSWFGFDHFYSDASFPQALAILFDEHGVRSLYDVGGNTGKWALQCVAYCPEAEVTILDLPQQIGMMCNYTAGKPGAERIKGHGINLLDPHAAFPRREGGLDAIWMSQFLDCFSMPEIVSILTRAQAAMSEQTRKYPPSAFALTMTSLYFTAIANGNSKMYNTEDMQQCIEQAGLEIERIHDGLGLGHSIMVCKLKD